MKRKPKWPNRGQTGEGKNPSRPPLITLKWVTIRKPQLGNRLFLISEKRGFHWRLGKFPQFTLNPFPGTVWWHRISIPSRIRRRNSARFFVLHWTLARISGFWKSTGPLQPWLRCCAMPELSCPRRTYPKIRVSLWNKWCVFSMIYVLLISYYHTVKQFENEL